MKNLLILLSLTFCAFTPLISQEAKPAKIRYTADFFGNRFEIGDKDSKPKDVLLHLEKNSPKGYFEFRKGVNQSQTGLVFSIISISSGVWYLLEKKPVTKNIALLTFSTTAIVYLSLDLSSKNKFRKGVDIYNKQFGY